MREKTTSKLQKEKKGPSVGKVAAGAVLATTLLLTPTVSSAQGVKVSKKNQPEKQIVEKAPVVESDSDTTITWDGFMGGPNLEPDPEWLEISEEEIQKYIQEYIENHKEDLIKRLKDEKINEQAFDIVYKEVMNNEEIQDIIKEMVKRADIKQAVLDGDEKYIQLAVNRFILKDREHHFWVGGILGAGLSCIILFLVLAIVSSRKEAKKKNNEGDNTEGHN